MSNENIDDPRLTFIHLVHLIVRIAWQKNDRAWMVHDRRSKFAWKTVTAYHAIQRWSRGLGRTATAILWRFNAAMGQLERLNRVAGPAESKLR